MARLKVGVLISGRGSNLHSLIEACRAPDFPAEIVLVISNKADALGLDHAKAASIPAQVISHKDFPDRERFDAELDRALSDQGVELVCLAGFMRLLTAEFTERWRGRMINIHPSLLPSFKGLHTHRQALQAGVKLHGCTVHHVTTEMDEGEIIAQAALPVLPGDDEESLAARVLEAEHRLYPMALRMIAGGLAGRLPAEDAALFNPLP